jgi:hypothetical protein
LQQRFDAAAVVVLHVGGVLDRVQHHAEAPSAIKSGNSDEKSS